MFEYRVVAVNATSLNALALEGWRVVPVSFLIQGYSRLLMEREVSK